MDPNPLSHSPTPAQATIPEEDATLLAIEALEARAIDLDIVVPPPQPAVPEPRKTIGPIVQPVPPRVPAPQIIPPPVVPKPDIVVPKPVPQPTMQPVTNTPPKPARAETPAEQIANELKSASSFPVFQFFARQKPPRRQFVIIGAILVIIALGVGGYFFLI